MSNNQTAVTVPEKLKSEIAMGDGGLVLRDINDLWRLADGIHRAKMAPRSLDSADKVAIAILTGAELGWKPMLAVRSIAVINGVPGLVTAAARARLYESGNLKPGTRIEEGVEHANDCEYEKEGKRCVDACHGYCQTWRNGHADRIRHTFYVHEAKTAGLWKKAGPWQEYPTRMLMHRAAGFHFRDCWGMELNGLDIVEAIRDYPQAAFVKEGETVATYTEPPGRDPLLPRATSEPEVTGGPRGEGFPGGAALCSWNDLVGPDGEPITEIPTGETTPAAPDAEPEQIDEATRKQEAESRAMPTTDESLDRLDAEMAQATKDLTAEGAAEADEIPQSVLDAEAAQEAAADHGLVLDEPEAEEMVCARDGCGIIIGANHVRWKVAKGWHCADCGPEK